MDKQNIENEKMDNSLLIEKEVISGIDYNYENLSVCDWCYSVTDVIQCLASFIDKRNKISGVIQRQTSFNVWRYLLTSVTKCLAAFNDKRHSMSGVIQ